MLFLIKHLSPLSETMFPVFELKPTDYGPLPRKEAEEIVAELNSDSVDSGLLDRWTIISQAE